MAQRARAQAERAGVSWEEARRGFVAIDGEALEGPDGPVYALLCNSHGHAIRAQRGLGTARVFDFLLDSAETGRLIAFGLDYDVNHWLRDVPPAALRTLAKRGEVRCFVGGRGFWLRWLPRKCFAVSDIYRGRTAKVDDVWGFFQASFVDALDTWGVADADGTVARMKAARGSFRPEDAREVERYCKRECRLLVALMDRVRASLREAGIDAPRSWVGAGAIAQNMLTQFGVRAHHAPDPHAPPELAQAIESAYFGGRVEMFQQGEFPLVWKVDINSAYPAAAFGAPPHADGLPSLAGGVWERASSRDGMTPWALWHVRWHLPEGAPLMPLPFRLKSDVYYPSNGEGWYWEPEVAQAVALFGQRVEVLGGWIFRPASACRPFDFIGDLYRARRRYKAAGSPAERVVKLGMNSLYGKLAQSVGVRGALPAYRSLVWAGLITSRTRAQVLGLAALAPAAVVAIATDAVFFAEGGSDVVREPLPAPSEELGGYSVDGMRRVLMLANGVYCGQWEDGGGWLRRARGFLHRDLDYAKLRRGWRASGPFFAELVVSRQFVGLRSALAAPDGPAWRSWAERTTTLDFDCRPRKWYEPGVEAELWDGRPSVRLYPPTMREGVMSAPYPGKGTFSSVPADPNDPWAAETEQPGKV